MLRRCNISHGPCLKHMGLALGPTKKDTRLLICLHVFIHFFCIIGQINTPMKRHKKVLKRLNCPFVYIEKALEVD